MNSNYLSVLVVFAYFVAIPVCDAGEFPDEHWTEASPRQMQRWSMPSLHQAEAYWRTLGSTAVMVVEDGAVVRAWGDVKRPVQCYSVRKSFLSVLYGIYQQKGTIDLNATMAQLKIDDVPPGLSADEKKATVCDLLKARSGIYHPAAYETQSMKERRPKRGSHPAGTFWYYNNWDFNALGRIFQRQTGRSVFDAFQGNLADAIGMSDFSERDTKFVSTKDSRFPAYTFQMSTRDRARFGLLCLRNGEWSGKQLVPANWFKESTVAYSQTGPGVGYGYMWWVSVDGWHLGNKFKSKTIRPYSARGNYGQYIVVIPEMDLVVVQSVDKSAGDKTAKGKSFNALLKLILASRTR